MKGHCPYFLNISMPTESITCRETILVTVQFIAPPTMIRLKYSLLVEHVMSSTPESSLTSSLDSIVHYDSVAFISGAGVLELLL
jgi:hypothetical protein